MSINLLLFIVSLLFFHASEVALVLRYEPHSFSFRSFLLTPPYLACMLFSLLEYFVTLKIFKTRSLLLLHYSFLPGVCGVLIGEALRKAAWFTARSHFSHDVRIRRSTAHNLITHGVYKWTRHPAYLGWFIWALSTQVLLANPCSFVVFTVVIWNFFKQRIAYEELFLIQFFGSAYKAYRNATPTRIPSIP